VTAYIDSSVVLRVLLGQADSLAAWLRQTEGVSSVLTEVECLRAVDKLRLSAGLDPEEAQKRRRDVYQALRSLATVQLSAGILERAAAPLPAPLNTLDALHLATALEVRRRRKPTMTFATHDSQLAAAARAFDFEVVGS
jgi:uncharacterized protein